MTKNNLVPFLLRATILFLGLIFIYSFVMYLAYLIPQESIQDNLQLSIDTINQEVKRWQVLPGREGTRLDTFTDHLIFDKMTNLDDYPPLQAAFWSNGYVRYWLGPIAILRPLLVIFDYTNFRHLNLYIQVFLTMWTLFNLEKLLGRVYSALFLIQLLLMHAWIFPLSLQYSPVYIISLMTILSVTYLWDRQAPLENYLLLFLLVGSVTNFFDLLTVPLLTWGLAWMVYLALVISHSPPKSPCRLWWTTFQSGLIWAMAYGGTWLAKWSLGSLVLKINIFTNVKNQAMIRTQGNQDEVLDYGHILERLLKILLTNEARLLLALSFLALIISWCLYKAKPAKWMQASPFLAMALIPFVWTFILKNHNDHHAYFTYRLLVLTVFGLYNYLWCQVAWPKRKKTKQRSKEMNGLT
ncbi:TPA: hypothetical protein ACGO1T_000940 [Streptococcus suis]